MRGRLALLILTTVAIGAVARADGNPDSLTQPLEDGCNRSQLVLLGEAVVDLIHRSTMEVAPEWVYVGAPGETRTIRTLEGQVLGTHTAGQDLFGSHKSYDLNIDVAPDPAYVGLLSTRNARETPPQIHTESEPLNVPTWVWPSPGDRVRETGAWIWDCGHWQEGDRQFDGSDNIPGDPLGTAGIEPIGGEETEIHPISELATWRSPRGFVPPGEKKATPLSQLDMYISNQGGGAKAVEECALSPKYPANQPQRVAEDAGCSERQNVTDRDYTYTLLAPPSPGPGAKLSWLEIPRSSHHAPPATVVASGDRITVTVPFSRKDASDELQDFGASYLAWWSRPSATVHRFRVSLNRLEIFNNLDADAGSAQSNPEVAAVSPNGEWNMYLDVTGQWRTLHDEIAQAHIGDLDNVGHATRAAPQSYDLSSLLTTEVDLTDEGSFRMFVDARDCDLPGFVDCPADREIDFSQHPGRAESVIPVTQLTGTTTTFTITPQTCDGSCPEERSDPACGGPCYALTFTVTDLGTTVHLPHALAGDGTRRGTTYDGVPATSLAWWRDPVTPVSLDQNEEAEFIRRAIEDLRAR